MIEIVTNPQLLAARTQAAAEAPAASGNKFAQLLQKAEAPSRELSGIFAKAAETYQIPEQLLRAIAYHESRYQPEVVSSAGAMGVMQLMPATAHDMGVSNPFDPEQNIMGGAKLLGRLFEKYDGDLKLTLAAYGAGSGSVAKYGGVPPFEETQNFVRDIMAAVGDISQEHAPVQHPSATYTGMMDCLLSFQDFTEADYRLLLAYLHRQQTDSADAWLRL